MSLTSNADPVRVLVVDDTDDIRLLLRFALEVDGDIVVVDEAADGRGAIDAARRTQPDVVLLDLAMPVMDGLQALPHLREASPRSAVVVLSGFAAGSMAEAALRAGAVEYLQKGATPDDIVGCVRRWGGVAPAPSLRSLPTQEPARGLPSSAVVWGWLEEAPYATIVIDAQSATVLHHNAAARSALGWGRVPPDDAVEQLGALRGTDAVAAVVDDAGRRVVFLAPAGGDATDGELARTRAAIASTAHEIRNPVATLMGIAHLLSSKGDQMPRETQVSMLDALVRQAQVLDRVTSDLLTASQVDRGGLQVDIRDVRLEPAIRAAVAVVSDQVRIDCSEDLVVSADPIRLDQMLGNLLSNASKYGAPPIRVVARNSARGIEVAVEDAGAGVPEDFRELLFSQFARAPGSTVTGSGIGLFIVHRLAELQRGEAWYEPIQPHGSRFVFSLPIPARGALSALGANPRLPGNP